jgi:hypothetical protein
MSAGQMNQMSAGAPTAQAQQAAQPAGAGEQDVLLAPGLNNWRAGEGVALVGCGLREALQ